MPEAPPPPTRRIVERLVELLGNPLEWSSSTRATALLGATSLYHLQYVAFNHAMLSHPLRDELVDVGFMQASLGSYVLLFALSVLGTVSVPALRHLFGDSVLYEYLATQYYACTLVYFGYAIGILNISTGVVIAAAPVVGFILFDRGAVFSSMLSALVLLAVITYLTTRGDLVYAPALRNYLRPDGSLHPFWVRQLFLFVAPHFLLLTVIAYYVLGRWREREAEILRLSMTDPLTGLLNRRSTMQQLEKAHALSVRERRPFAVVVVDLDHFKRINDTYGHHVGDAVLVEAARSMQGSIRQTDVIGRIGGEEFLLVLPGTDLAGATALAERCRVELARICIDVGRSEPLRISGSLGLASNEDELGAPAEVLVRRADEALYASKDAGRNRLSVAGAL